MKKHCYIVCGLLLLCLITNFSIGEQTPSPTLVQATLTQPNGTSFHLKALITERADPNEDISVEMFWVSPSKWRRTIESQEFSQTLIVNGDNFFEKDSDDYFPLGIRTLVTAMVDPQLVLNAVRPGDLLLTKANGASDESGTVCYSKQMCMRSPYGLQEIVDGPGHSVTFTNYKPFKHQRVARLLIYKIDAGDNLRADLTELEELKNPDESLFSISEPSSKEKRIQSIILPETDLKNSALQPLEIIWPQVLDGATSGETSFYVSIDRSGNVREALPLSVAIERANDSAIRQIMKWKFKPIIEDGLPVQAEAILNFNFNTREYGPADPLTDAEVRKLASTTAEPAFEPGIAPGGSTCTILVAVDSDGRVIETIAGDAPRQLYPICMQTIGKWKFNPILQDGKPFPYRAKIVFKVP
jgi:hypothetical protein